MRGVRNLIIAGALLVSAPAGAQWSSDFQTRMQLDDLRHQQEMLNRDLMQQRMNQDDANRRFESELHLQRLKQLDAASAARRQDGVLGSRSDTYDLFRR